MEGSGITRIVILPLMYGACNKQPAPEVPEVGEFVPIMMTATGPSLSDFLAGFNPCLLPVAIPQSNSAGWGRNQRPEPFQNRASSFPGATFA